MRRVFGDALASAAALGAVLLALVAVDERVRELFATWMNGGGRPSTHLADAGSQVVGWTGILFDAARDQSLEHAPLLIFVLAASVLLLFMFRT